MLKGRVLNCPKPVGWALLRKLWSRTSVIYKNYFEGKVQQLCKKGGKKVVVSVDTSGIEPDTFRRAPSKCEANVINQLHHVPLIVLDTRCSLDLARQMKATSLTKAQA